MSVINEMLRDLEQRKAPDRSELDAVSSNESLIETKPQSLKKYLIALIVILLVIGVGVGNLLLRDYDLIAKPQSQQKLIAPIDSEEVINEPALEQRVMTKFESQPEQKPVLKPVVVTIEKEPSKETEAVQTNTAITPKPVITALQDKDIQQIEAVEKKTEREDISTEVRAVKVEPIEASIEEPGPITKEVDASKVVNQTEPVSENSVNVLAKEISLTPISEVRASKPVVRLQPAISPQRRDQNMADLSRELFKAGESRKAYRSLYDFMAAYQVDQQSRIVLISYLLQDLRIAEAGDVLVTTEVEQSPELRQLKARWYVAQGEHKLALHTLRENLPELESYPEYYALLAAYYQRFGYSVKAAETYTALLEYDNESANWWAGLAIALDSAKQYQDAVKAYKQALAIPELSQELFEYIENRLSLLTDAASR